MNLYSIKSQCKFNWYEYKTEKDEEKKYLVVEYMPQGKI